MLVLIRPKKLIICLSPYLTQIVFLQVKKLKQTTVPSDQVKKIIATRDEFKQKFDSKSAETRQKETELADIRVKADATQKKVTELETSIAKLTEKDKKNEEDAAKEKDKFRRLQQLAKGYRKQG